MTNDEPKRPDEKRPEPNAAESIEAAKLRTLMANLRRTVPTTVAIQSTLAECRRASFNAHVEAGFTEAQALVLCTKLEWGG